MKSILNINGQMIEVKIFKTLKAAQNYISKNKNSEILISMSHKYVVNI